jgi:predicted DNA-binding transcriptional regulator YafY
MRRADRLFMIVQHLRGGRIVTARQLAERLEVSERTIYRDIADLIGADVPVDGEAGVGYVMRAGYDLPPLMFTRDEVAALVTGARLVRAWGGAAMARAAEEALIKIDAVLPEAERGRAAQLQVHAMATPEMTAPLRARLDALNGAVERAERLEIGYADSAGRVTERVIRPLGLWFWGKVWTLIAWCELRSDFRMFRVDRIARMTALDRFRPEPGKTLRDFYRALEAREGHRPDWV